MLVNLGRVRGDFPEVEGGEGGGGGEEEGGGRVDGVGDLCARSKGSVCDGVCDSRRDWGGADAQRPVVDRHRAAHVGRFAIATVTGPTSASGGLPAVRPVRHDGERTPVVWYVHILQSSERVVMTVDPTCKTQKSSASRASTARGASTHLAPTTRFIPHMSPSRYPNDTAASTTTEVQAGRCQERL
jgi:hypothetical protein